MKSLFSFLLFVLFSISLSAQNTLLSLEVQESKSRKYSKNSKKSYKTFIIQSALYENTPSTNGSNARGGGAQSGGEKYKIQRPSDNSSSFLENASTKGVFFNSAMIETKGQSNGDSRIDFQKAIIMNFSTSIENGVARDNFDLIFESKQISSL